jgi:hypothetical protein
MIDEAFQKARAVQDRWRVSRAHVVQSHGAGRSGTGAAAAAAFRAIEAKRDAMLIALKALAAL